MVGGSTLWRNARIATMAGARYSFIERGALRVDGETLGWVGRDDALPRGPRIDAEHDVGGALLTPGLIDCHTHLVYAGQRAHEFERRLQGVSYEQIAREGGGIRATVAATRAASDEQLLALALARLDALRAEGVTTVEVKSGYGLTARDEARLLSTARRLARERRVTVQATYLAAHAVPPEYDGRADAYIDAVCNWLPALHADGLVDAVDAFCDRIGFTREQTQRVLDAAYRLGLPVKLHAEQLGDSGGATLAARYGALSCDHLEHLSYDGVRALAAAGTVAVLLPGAYYFLCETKPPPVAALRTQRVPMAVATDHNPGTSPTGSLLLMLNMACTLFRLTPEEAFAGVTLQAARALGLQRTRGSVEAGKRADFAVWDAEHPNELAYAFGRNPCRKVVAGGEEQLQ